MIGNLWIDLFVWLVACRWLAVGLAGRGRWGARKKKQEPRKCIGANPHHHGGAMLLRAAWWWCVGESSKKPGVAGGG